MWSGFITLIACIIVPLVSAQDGSCISTTTVTTTQPPTTITTSTSAVITRQTTFTSLTLRTTYIVKTITIPTTTLAYTTIIPVTTVTKNAGTKTSGRTALVTKSCPSVAVTKCSGIIATKTETETTGIYDFETLYTTTVTSTITYVSQVSYTFSTSTVTNGNPPTTSLVTKKVTPAVVRSTITDTVYGNTLFTTFTTTSGTVTVSTTHTKTVSPTATATITVFSLQLVNVSSELDGGTAGPIFNNYDNPLYLQTTDTYQFYISPSTGRLIELTTRDHAVNECLESEQCPNRDGVAFVPDGEPVPVTDGVPLYGSTYYCTATCGKPLACTIDGQPIGFGVEVGQLGNYFVQRLVRDADTLLVVGPTPGFRMMILSAQPSFMIIFGM